MRKIYGYGDIRRVVGIPYTNYLGYNNSYRKDYNSRYYRRQQERELSREQKRRQKDVLRKPEVKENIQTYKSQDAKLIYFQEYCKVRNTEIYRRLNPTENDNIINFETRSSQYVKPNNTKVNKMIETYNQTKKSQVEIIEFEKRKAEKRKQENSRPVKKQEEKKVMTKREEVIEFKKSYKPREKTELDKAVENFEKALKERNRQKASKGRRKGFER